MLKTFHFKSFFDAQYSEKVATKELQEFETLKKKKKKIKEKKN